MGIVSFVGVHSTFVRNKSGTSVAADYIAILRSKFIQLEVKSM